LLFTENYVLLYFVNYRGPYFTLWYRTYITHFRNYKNYRKIYHQSLIGYHSFAQVSGMECYHGTSDIQYKDILPDFAISEKFAQLLHFHILVPFVTCELQVLLTVAMSLTDTQTVQALRSQIHTL
jgi:hypothetical protein